MKTLKAGLLYFALVFGAGFVLGAIRVTWVVPRFGVRSAELAEMPLMLLVIVVAARWIVNRLRLPTTFRSRLGMGFLALALLLACEFTLVLGLRGITMAESFAERDPVSGAVYLLMLIVFAMMPLFMVRFQRLRD